MAFVQRSLASKAPLAARSMATLKEVEGRIKSTANIAKITKAMQMVAASKLKGAESKLAASRPLMQMVTDMTAHIENCARDCSSECMYQPFACGISSFLKHPSGFVARSFEPTPVPGEEEGEEARRERGRGAML